jgi:N-carbamoyl-L-amino-acid hydrolase
MLRELLAEIGADDIDVDEAGNLWARLPGADRSAPALAVGSHLDSVPAGGRLDGALGVLAGLGLLRAWADAERTPPRDIVLIDFADEEGARFGRSLFGSSALAGTLVPEELSSLTDSGGRPIGDVLGEQGVDLAAAPTANARLAGLGTYLELHIEQGPVLEAEGVSCSAVSGCAGVERHLLSFRGQASHAGTTPMDARRDATLAAAETALAVERIAVGNGGVGTTGQLELEPGVVTAVAGAAQLAVDLRHPQPDPLAAMLADVLAAARAAAGARDCTIEPEAIWTIEPIPFDAELVRAAELSVAGEGGRKSAIASGALHDAAELARRIPTVMVFAASIRGISHAKEEDSTEADLVAAIGAYGRLAASVI